MRKDVYIYTRKKGAIDCTVRFARGGVVVALDFNTDKEVVGIEVLDAREVAINGKCV